MGIVPEGGFVLNPLSEQTIIFSFLLSSPNSSDATSVLPHVLNMLDRMGVAAAVLKIEGPATT